MLHHMDNQNKILNLYENFWISWMYGLFWRGLTPNLFTDFANINIGYFLSNIHISNRTGLTYFGHCGAARNSAQLTRWCLCCRCFRKTKTELQFANRRLHERSKALCFSLENSSKLYYRLVHRLFSQDFSQLLDPTVYCAVFVTRWFDR